MSTWLDKPDADGLWWKQVKSGDICGVSIGCRASVEQL